MSTANIVCAGPHVDPVVIGTVSYPDSITIPVDHRALCTDCGQVYAVALADPATITDPTTGKPAPNPDKLAPGQIPDAGRVERIKQRSKPDWTPPPHNYKTPPGQA